MALKDARGGQPPSDQTELGASERILLQYRDTTVRRIAVVVARALDRARKWLLRCTPRTISTKANQAGVSAFISSEITAALGKLSETAERYEETLKRLERFKKEHKIDRDATVNTYLIDSLGPLMLLVVFEIILNASLLGSVSQQGFLGGAVYAILFSFFNVGWALFVGMFGWRYALYKQGAQRVWALGLTVAGVAVTLFMNLFIAHYRQVAEETLQAYRSNPAELGVLESVSIADVLARVFAAPSFQSRESILLLILGLAIAIFATWEGMWKLVDRIPDYGAVWKDYKRARRERDRVITTMAKAIGRTLDALIKTILDVEVTHAFYEKEMGKAKIGIQQFYQEAEEFAGMADAWAEHWIGEYRRVNANERMKLSRRFRKGQSSILADPGPAPKYFSRPVPFVVHLPSVAEAVEEAETGRRIARQNLERLAELRAWIADRKRRLRDELKDVSSNALISASAEYRTVHAMLAHLEFEPPGEADVGSAPIAA